MPVTVSLYHINCIPVMLGSMFPVLTALALLIGNFILIGPTVGIKKALSSSLPAFGVAWYIYPGCTMKRLRTSCARRHPRTCSNLVSYRHVSINPVQGGLSLHTNSQTRFPLM